MALRSRHGRYSVTMLYPGILLGHLILLRHLVSGMNSKIAYA